MKTPVDYIFGETLPEPGQVLDVAEGIRWIRMPLPFALNHVNLFLIDDGDGWVLIDTGIGLPETQGLWETILANSLHGRPITKILVTHFHPDHMGCAGWLTEKLGVEMWTSRAEWLSARSIRLDDSTEFLDNLVSFYVKTGLGTAMAGELRTLGNSYRQQVAPVPMTYHKLADGDLFEIGRFKFRVVIGSGHSPEHICLHCAETGIMLGGDFLLPRISPNVSVWWSEPDSNPLNDYFDFLSGLDRIDPEILVLPSHDRPYRGLDKRVRDLLLHHEERLDLAQEVCRTPSSAADVMRRMFQRELDTHQTRFAIGESLSHINKLLADGRITRRLGDDGAWIYEAA